MTLELDSKTQQVFEEIKTLTFLQTANLVKAFEDEFGISAAAPVAVASVAPGASDASGGDVEEQTEFAIELTDVGANKIPVLKEVRAITGLGLKEAKEKVDNTPSILKENVKKEDAQAAKEKLEAAGAKVSLK